MARFKTHGGDAIHGDKGTSFKSDGLVVRGCWIDDNDGDGIYLGPNSHYCEATDGCRIVNNRGFNINIDCVGFNMWGGVVGGSGTSRLVNCSAGGIWGTTFEATPSAPVDLVLLQLGDSIDGACRGVSVTGCKMIASGNPSSVTLIHAVDSVGLRVIGGHMDANSVADIVGVRIASAANDTAVEGVSFGGNIGAGSFENIVREGV